LLLPRQQVGAIDVTVVVEIARGGGKVERRAGLFDV
jgi:hypothetical protein